MDTPKMKHTQSGDISGQIFNLADMVSYQDGSIVSREVISAKAGTLTVFAFDRNQGLSEHTAPFDAFVQILDGDAFITISGEEFHLKTGEMIIMPAHKPHGLKAGERFKMLLVLIKKEVS
jgi:quercetin dioxygenase-like cupin family protein